MSALHLALRTLWHLTPRSLKRRAARALVDAYRETFTSEERERLFSIMWGELSRVPDLDVPRAEARVREVLGDDPRLEWFYREAFRAPDVSVEGRN